ncbi:MAG: hypothetical protein H7Z37_18005, partial [Pyrinomonadaceae bacterium]|nr:hypothetical protein [Pyrinomonadaceae bacterium]
ADYLPAPFGLTNFANPVEEVYPSLVPFIELSDGKIYAASDGADVIEPSDDGKSLRVVWKKWARINSKSGERFDIGLTAEVKFKIENNRLFREETLTSNKDLLIKNWRIAFPMTADKTFAETKNNARTDFFVGADKTLSVNASFDWQTEYSILATGDSRLGKGTLGAIPLHLIYTSKNLQLRANAPRRWKLELAVLQNKD